MSAPAPIDSNPEVLHAPEGLSRPLVLGALFGAIAFSLVLCLVAYALMRHDRRGVGMPDGRSLGIPHDVAGIRETLFWPAQPGPTLPAEQRRHLDGYRWVDRSAGSVSIPVERAIDIVLGAKGGTP